MSSGGTKAIFRCGPRPYISTSRGRHRKDDRAIRSRHSSGRLVVMRTGECCREVVRAGIDIRDLGGDNATRRVGDSSVLKRKSVVGIDDRAGVA